MKRVIGYTINEDAIHWQSCNPSLIVAQTNGKLGVIQTIVDEGLTTYRILWNNGDLSTEYNSLRELLNSHDITKFYQL